MATMPDINYGSRQLAIPGGVIAPMTNAGASRYRLEMGRDIQHSLDTASRAFFQIERIKDQADRRDAEYAMRQAQNWFDAEWYGRDEVDPQTGEKKHIAGVADRDYRSFEMDKTDSMKECARLKKEFRETDIYKNLSGGVKNHFDRQFAIYEGRLDNAAAENHRKLAAQKINIQNADKVKFVSGNVQRDFGANDATFENSAAWGATQMTAMTLGSLVENSDEIAANPNARVKDIVFRGGKRFDQLTAQEQKYVTDVFDKSAKNFRVERIKALSDAAASGRTIGGFATPEACLDKALEMTFCLNGAPNGFDPKTGAKNPGKDGKPCKVILNDVERNEVLAYIDKAKHDLGIQRTRQQKETADAEESGLDKLQWELAPSTNGSDGTFDASKILQHNFDVNSYRATLNAKVANNTMTPEAAIKLMGRFEKMAAWKEGIAYDLQHPEQFAAKSDPIEWCRVKQMIADAERLGTPADQLQEAVEGIKTKLTSHDYFSLWQDARQKRNSEDDRIANQVLSTFLGISENETATALDPKKRGSSESNDAISTLLGSSSAEYVMSGRWSNPDFEIADVDEAKKLLVDYLDKHPGDMAGADRLLRDLVEPASREARARSFRDRIQKVRRHERSTGNTGIFSVQRAFGDEDGGGEIRPLPDDIPTASGKAETRRPTRRHN